MAKLSDLTELKTKVDLAKQQSLRAAGALGQLMDRLKKEHGCASIAEAERLLQKIDNEARSKQVEFDTALLAFKKAHGQTLGSP